MPAVWLSGRSVLCFGLWLYRNHTAVSVATMKLHYTFNKGIQGMIATHSHVFTGIMNRTTLAYDDVTCYAGLSAKDFYA